MRPPITTSASDESDEAHSSTSEREAIDRFADLLSEIDRIERGEFKISDRGTLIKGDRFEIVACWVFIRLTHDEILLIFEGDRDGPPPMSSADDPVTPIPLNEITVRGKEFSEKTSL